MLENFIASLAHLLFSQALKPQSHYLLLPKLYDWIKYAEVQFDN